MPLSAIKNNVFPMFILYSALIRPKSAKSGLKVCLLVKLSN